MSIAQLIRSFNAQQAIPFYLTPTLTVNNPNAYGTQAGDSFGSSVATDGNYVVVGANSEDDAPDNNSGKAYIFDATTGSLLHTLSNPNAYGTSANDNFGTHAAISGNHVVVGVPNEGDAGGTQSGKAYIFDATTGSLLHTLSNPNAYGTSASDQFGRSVSISGNRVIVGAPYEDDAPSNGSGKAYIFDVTTGSLLHTLSNPNAYGTSANDNFGYSISISGNYAIFGSHLEDEVGNTDSGKAYIFDVTTGSLLRTLSNPNAYGTSASDQFGVSVAISGNLALIGARYEADAGGTLSGKAYIFDVTTGSLLHTLNNPNAHGTSANDNFGSTVSISGNLALVGVSQEDDASGTTSGKAYIFDVTTGSLLHTLNNPNPVGASAGDSFGGSVAIFGNRAVVGAFAEDYLGSGSGSVYVYQIP